MSIKDELCVSPSLKRTLKDVGYKYAILKDFGSPWQEGAAEPNVPLSPTEGCQKLNEALLEFREKLLDGMQEMATEIKD
jgi:hypothetical protein